MANDGMVPQADLDGLRATKDKEIADYRKQIQTLELSVAEGKELAEALKQDKDPEAAKRNAEFEVRSKELAKKEMELLVSETSQKAGLDRDKVLERFDKLAVSQRTTEALGALVKDMTTESKLSALEAENAKLKAGGVDRQPTLGGGGVTDGSSLVELTAKNPMKLPYNEAEAHLGKLRKAILGANVDWAEVSRAVR